MSRKLFAISILFIVTLLFVGCGGASERTPEEAAVANALNALQQLDEETMERYFPNNNPLANLGDEEEEVLRLFVENISFNIISSSVDGNSAVVKTEITNINLGIIFSEYIEQLMETLMAGFLTGAELTEEEMDKMFFDLLKRPDNEMMTTTVDVRLIKDGYDWVIDADDDFADAVFGGMIGVVEEALGF